MKITIHRGTREIGGSCVELCAAGTRIIVDFGLPLVSGQNKQFDARILQGKSIEQLKDLKIIPDIRGLYEGEKKEVDAILISHSHLDHYGLLGYVNRGIPVYLSQGALSIMKASSIFCPVKVAIPETEIILPRAPFRLGDFKITPYLVDHSAFDALAFLIEAQGKRLFYSGDFRGHGRKSVLFERMVKTPPRAIDCLLMEGSMLGRDSQRYDNEVAVQARIEEVLKARDNMTFLFASSQNIDRIVSAYKACLRTESIFVIDIYTSFILDKLYDISRHIPQFDWKNVRVKYLKYHADKLAGAGHRDLLYKYNKAKIKMPEIDREKKRILMLARDNSVFPKILGKIKGLAGAKILYSMWEGYLTDEFRKYCSTKKLDIERVHTSGHATIDDLKTFAQAVKPRILIPIHTFFAHKYRDLYDHVRILDDGEIFDI